MPEFKCQATTYVPYRERYISIYQATVIISCIEVCVHLATLCINKTIQYLKVCDEKSNKFIEVLVIKI